VCSYFQQPYVLTTKKAFTCRIERAVKRMKDSVFVWPRVNGRLIIPYRIITTRHRGWILQLFPLSIVRGVHAVFSPLPYPFVFVCVYVFMCGVVCVLLDEVVLSNLSFLLGYLCSFFFVLFSRALTACCSKAKLIARVIFSFLCFVQQLLFPNNQRNSNEKRGSHRLIVKFCFMCFFTIWYRCILSNLLLLLPLLLLQR
jgi:hypothetical protein